MPRDGAMYLVSSLECHGKGAIEELIAGGTECLYVDMGCSCDGEEGKEKGGRGELGVRRRVTLSEGNDSSSRLKKRLLRT